MSKTMPRVFISRDLTAESPLRSLGSNIEIIGKSLLTFTPVSFGPIPDCDWIFFYSQQGVVHFFNGTTEELPHKKLAAFGKKTGEALKSKGFSIAFTGDGQAANTARSFALVANNDRVVFARARHSRQSLQTLLENKVKVIDLVVYDNEPVQFSEIPFCDALIFTSPMNAITYYKLNKPADGQKVFAIGATTKRALEALGIVEIQIPTEPSESALARLLKNHFTL
jgi:uroporphyrinogen-III synthase